MDAHAHRQDVFLAQNFSRMYRAHSILHHVGPPKNLSGQH
jgi:hypothetical protein